MNEQLYCQGCGAPIQTENKQEPGYVPESALHQEQLIWPALLSVEKL